MKKSIQIQIPEPCHENWDKMTTSNQGRFCNACNKVVVDFSMMSDKEILNHLSKASSKICGRVSDDQLNRPIQMPVEKRRISFKYLWSMLISTFLVSYKTQAQGAIKLDSIPVTAQRFPANELQGAVGGMVFINKKSARIRTTLVKGRVTDENGVGITFATIKISDSKYGAVTDSSGEFQVKIKSSLLNFKLTASSIGYETVSIDLKNEDTEDLNILMVNPKSDLMGVVTVTSYPPKTCRITLGGLSYGITVSENRFKTAFNELIGRNEIKIFPNPVKPGNAINISFNVVETGNYKLELFDASGRMMHTSTVSIPSKKFVMNFGSSLPLIPGIYFVKVLNAKGKNVYNGSLVVQ